MDAPTEGGYPPKTPRVPDIETTVTTYARQMNCAALVRRAIERSRAVSRRSRYSRNGGGDPPHDPGAPHFPGGPRPPRRPLRNPPPPPRRPSLELPPGR